MRTFNIPNSILALVCLSITSLGFAAENDVTPKNFGTGSRYVRITPSADGRSVTFEDCRKGIEAKSCKAIGHKGTYELADLESQRLSERTQIAASLLGDVGVVFGAIYAGWYGGVIASTMVGSTAPEAFILYGSSGAIIGAAGGITADILVDALNPVEQYRQAATLNDEVIRDRPVAVDHIDKFIKRLALVLNKL